MCPHTLILSRSSKSAQDRSCEHNHAYGAAQSFGITLSIPCTFGPASQHRTLESPARGCQPKKHAVTGENEDRTLAATSFSSPMCTALYTFPLAPCPRTLSLTSWSRIRTYASQDTTLVSHAQRALATLATYSVAMSCL